MVTPTQRFREAGQPQLTADLSIEICPLSKAQGWQKMGNARNGMPELACVAGPTPIGHNGPRSSLQKRSLFFAQPTAMLTTTLLHPDILRACARAGHHSKILIADGNYPAATKIGPRAELVCLQLSPGIPSVAQVLRAILSDVPIDAIQTMGIDPSDEYATPGDPPVWQEYRRILADCGSNRQLEPVMKWDFYAEVQSDDHILTIQTADTALWANLLLSVGVRQTP